MGKDFPPIQNGRRQTQNNQDKQRKAEAVKSEVYQVTKWGAPEEMVQTRGCRLSYEMWLVFEAERFECNGREAWVEQNSDPVDIDGVLYMPGQAVALFAIRPDNYMENDYDE